MGEINFSVLLSVYDKENPEYLKDSLNSIFNQTLLSGEVIIVEDGPLKDELSYLLDEYQLRNKQIIRIRLKKNKGLGYALNEGLKFCSNDLVIRMDSDDICFPNRFEKQVRFMIENPDIDICSSWIEEFESEISNIKAVKKVPESHEEIAKYIGSRNPLNHPAVIFRKSAVLKAGGYQPFHLFEDWFLWARMFVNGARFANIQECLLHFRVSPQMYKRRGGLKYAVNSTKFQYTLHKLGIISFFSAVKSSVMRTTVYLLPNSVRAFLYSKFLRS